MSNILTIATSQFAVNANISSNLKAILKQIREAGSRAADIIHFCESSLTGYPGIDYPEISPNDEPQLLQSLDKIRAEASKTGIWVIVGSHHFKKGLTKPYNCLYLINNKGEIANRYDKRFLTDTSEERDVDHYSPGNLPLVFSINGIRCGMLICHEWRYPELYREYYRMKVKVIFQSWYDGNQSPDKYIKEGKELGELIMGTVRGNAANNALWISGSNTSRRESSFPCFVIQPDGRIFNKLARNRSGVLISTIDTGQKFVDPSAHMRDRAGDIFRNLSP